MKSNHEKIMNFLYYMRGLPVLELYGDEKFINTFLVEDERKYGSSYEITREIFKTGNCGNVFKMLQSFYPNAEAYLVNGKHVITKIEERYYDIDGEYILDKEDNIELMSEEDLEDFINNYSFYARGPIL